METYTGAQTTLRDYLKVIFRHKVMIIAILIITMVSVSVVLELKTDTYRSQVRMLIAARMSTEAGYYRELFMANPVDTHKAILYSDPVMERVVTTLRLDERPLDYEKKFSSAIQLPLIANETKELRDRIETMKPEQRRYFLFRKAVSDLRENLEVESVKDTHLFTVTVTDFDPELAAIIANSVSRSYVIFDLEQQLAELKLRYGEEHMSIIQLETYMTNFQKHLDGKLLPVIESIGPATIKIVEQAKLGVPVNEVSKPILFALAFSASLLFGIILAFGFERLNQTFKSPQEVERFLNIPLLGAIPKKRLKDKLLISITNPTTSDYTRSYQNLSNQIYLLMKNKNMRTLLITHLDTDRDAANIIANLGIYLSHELEYKVLIIDANLRNPSISKLFNISDNTGLADALAGGVGLPRNQEIEKHQWMTLVAGGEGLLPLEKAVQPKERLLRRDLRRGEGFLPLEKAVQDMGSNLYILPAGQTALNPITLIDSSMMSEIMRKAKERYDIVLVNCTDLRNFTDAIVISSITDGVALVIEEGKTNRMMVRGMIAPLEQRKVNIIGAILNNQRYVLPKIIYKLT